jgi:hypothetical protein
MDIVTKTFVFNIVCIIIFAIIYTLIPANNFLPLNKKDNLNIVDYLFYSLTIQSGVGLPDVTAFSDLAKELAMIQQLILISSAYILLHVFYNKK